MKGFIDFIRKGNLVQLAVAFVMGLAFSAVVTSFVNDLITPLLGLFGGVDFSNEVYCMTGDCAAGTGVAFVGAPSSLPSLPSSSQHWLSTSSS